MNGVVTISKADAVALAAAVDSRLGYPRAAVPAGGGNHSHPETAITTTASDPLQHPTLGTWALPVSPEVAGVAGVTVALPVGAVVQLLDPTWFPTFATAVAAAIAQAEVVP